MPPKPRPHFTFDVENLLKDSATHTADGVGQVAGVNRVLNIGTGRVSAQAVFDVSALDAASNDEKYTLQVEGSESEDFSTGSAVLASVVLGAAEVILEDVDSAADRYVVPFSNVIADVVYPFIRSSHVVAGTSPSITYGSWLAKNPY